MRAAERASSALPSAPYPGLRPFEKHEWSIFFGRERMVDELLDRLAEHCLVVVHGSSGCGKSSLIRAGMLPKLEQEHARHGLAWRTATMRPGGAPLWNLADALAQLVDGIGDVNHSSIRAIRRHLNCGRHALTTLTNEIGLGRNSNICLLIDQFEELFRFARESGRDEAQVLIEVLRGFEDPPPGIHAILTLRSDYLGDCGRYIGFAELVNRTQYLLPRMADADLLHAIREPARLYHGEVTLDLAMRLIQESAGEADALPLVQHCLMYLWQQDPSVERPAYDSSELAESPVSLLRARRSQHILSLSAYRGLRESLSEHAEEVLTELERQEPAYLKIVEFLFRSLIEIDNQGRTIRRPRTFAELKAEIGVDSAVLERVIKLFRRPDTSFLTPYGDKPLTDSDIVDISHEALIRGWKRINDPTLDEKTGRPQGWLQHEEEDGRIWRSLLLNAEMHTLLSPALVQERTQWLKTLPTGAWSERHGGKRQQVDKLLLDSENAAKRRWLKSRLMVTAVSGIAVVLAILWIKAEESTKAAEQSLDYALASGEAWVTALTDPMRNLVPINLRRAEPAVARVEGQMKGLFSLTEKKDFSDLRESQARRLQAYKARMLILLSDYCFRANNSNFCWQSNNIERGLKLAQSAAKILRQMSEEQPHNIDLVRYLAESLNRISVALTVKNDQSGSIDTNREIISVFERISPKQLMNADNFTLAMSHILLGSELQKSSDLVQARQHFDTAMALANQLTNEEPENRDSLLADIHDALGQWHMASHDPAAALTAFNNALQLNEQAGLMKPEVYGWQLRTGWLHFEVGQVQLEQNNLEEALKSIHELTHITSELNVDDVNVKNNLSNLYYNISSVLSDNQSALENFHRGLEKALGPEHPGLADHFNSLALLYYAQRRYAEAEPLYQRALAIREKALGPEHPDVATSLNNLALLYYDQRRYAEAEPLYQRALAIREKALGPEHQDVATIRRALSALPVTQTKAPQDGGP